MEPRSKLNRRDFLRAGAALGGGLALAACAPGAGPAASAPAATASAAASLTPAQALAALEEAARAEGGQVLWYNAGNPNLVAKVTEGFQKAYPWAKFTGSSVPFTDMPNKLVTEAATGAPTADVVWCPPTLRQIFLKSNILTKVALSNDALMPKDSLDPDGYAHPVWQLVTAPVYNPNVLAETALPKDPFDLANPIWKGKLAFDRVQNLGQSTTWLSVWRKKWGDAKWMTWLDGVAANQVFITASAGAAYEAVLRGERQLGLSSSNNILSQRAGTPMKMYFGLPPVPFYNHSYLMAKAAHPKMGQLFMEWSSTEIGQKAIASSGLSPIMPIDDPNAVSKFLPSGVTPVTGAELADFANNLEEYVSHLSKRFPG
jgi:ABC-type Fe3+ transport system substrate-binding protein